MSMLARLTKLETLLMPIAQRYPPPVILSFMAANGELVEARGIAQLSNSWPLTVERFWLRGPGESIDEITARVLSVASPGSLLLMLTD